VENGERFEVDPRYEQAAKEARWGVALFLLNILWWAAFAYGLGSGPPSRYTYVFGFPAWFFWSVPGSFLVFSVLIYLVVKFFYRDMPLDAAEDGSGEAE